MSRELSREFIKTDRNGTKHYRVTCTCEWCKHGYIGVFSHIDGGRCYHCNGTGKEIYIDKEYTPEYAAKLAAKAEARAAKMQKEQAEKTAAKWNELYPENKVWFVVGNSYAIKDEIKAAGGKWLPAYSKWYFNQKPADNFKVFEVAADKVFDKIYYNESLKNFNIADGELVAIPDTLDDKLSGEYIGEIGKRIEIKVQLDNAFHIDVYFSKKYILSMKDENDNVFIWKTTNGDDFYSWKENGWKIGKIFTIKATVKEHSVYRGVKQTILSRCKVLNEITFDEYKKQAGQ